MFLFFNNFFKFEKSYSILAANSTSLEDAGPNYPGLISYALRGVFHFNYYTTYYVIN